jgi:hypothetical protein
MTPDAYETAATILRKQGIADDTSFFREEVLSQHSDLRPKRQIPTTHNNP